MDDEGQGMREALLRLTSPHYEVLHQETEGLRSKLDRALAELKTLEAELHERSEQTEGRDRALLRLVESTRAELLQAKQSISDPQEVVNRLSPVLVRVLHRQARQQEAQFAEAVAPVMGPAIRHQIREAKDDIIDALYPLIGQIIGKAISEAFRELTRNIDSRMRRQFNPRSQAQRISGRLRGVSEAEMILRDSIPFEVDHIFLIHRETGLLLEHIAAPGQANQEMATMSGMLTAIRDFVRDSFGGGEGDLEEITHGDQRVLLESGGYAYLAVVLDGVEPAGYNQLINRIIRRINLEDEVFLRDFDGVMDDMPNFRDDLAPLLAPSPQDLHREETKPISRTRRGIILGVLLIVLALVLAACIVTFWLRPIPLPW